MKLRHIFAYFGAVSISALTLGACETTSNMNARVSNANSNTAIVVNASATPTPRRDNSNITRLFRLKHMPGLFALVASKPHYS